MPDERIRVALELITGQYKREAREAAQATSQISQAAATGEKNVGFFERRFGTLAAAAKTAAVALIAVKLKQFAGDAVQAASSLTESINAVEQVFEGAAGRIKDFGQISAQAVGLSSRAFNEMATVTGAALQNFGYGADAAAKETIRLTQRASDMASVFNTDVSTAMDAINSALLGQSRPIRQFGVSLSDATVRAKAVELGLAETTSAVDQNAKAVATLQLIYEQTNKAAGDFAKTSDSLANTQRRAAARLENAQARFGQAAQRPLAALTEFAAAALDSFAALGGDEMAKAQLRFGEAMDHIRRAAEEGGDTFSALADSLLHLAVNGDLTTDQLETLATQAGLTADQYDLFGDAIEAQAEALGIAPELLEEIFTAMGGVGLAAGESAPLIDKAAGAMGRTGDAAARAASKVSDLIKAQRDYRTSLLESATPALAALRSLENLRSAQDAVVEAQKKGTKGTEELREAQLALAVAVFEAQGALNAFDASGVQRAIDGVALALGISKREAQDLLTQLGLIDGKEVTTVVRLNVTSNIPLGKLDRNTLSQILSGTVTTGTPQPRQHGGSVTGGFPYITGERGPELFIPQQSGSIISNRQLMAALGRQGSRSATINVISPTSHTLDQDLQYGALLANHMTLAS